MKTAKWHDTFTTGLVNSDPVAVRKSIPLSLPLREYVFGDKSHTPLHEALKSTSRGAATLEVLHLLLHAGAEVDAPLRERCVDLDEGMQ